MKKLPLFILLFTLCFISALSISYAGSEPKHVHYKNRVKRMALVANNGSGKSALVLAPCSVWTAMRYQRARVVITSASGTQLDRQTGRSVEGLCESVNATHKQEIWEIKYRNYTFLPTRSTIEMYSKPPSRIYHRSSSRRQSQ